MSSELKRDVNESLLDFQIRICSNKTQYGLSWEGVKDVLNKELGENFGESKYRKWFQNFQDGFDYAIEKNANSNDEIEELEEKIKEFEIAKIQFQDKKREYRHYLRHDGRLDNLLKHLIETFKEDMVSKKPLEWIKPTKDEQSEGALMLLLSDLHRGMKSDNHWNIFNEEVFEERLNKVIQDTVKYQEITNTKELHVMGLGDYLEGNLHRLTKIGETETAVEQTQRVAEELSEMLSYFSSKFEKVYFYSVKGNHDRVSSRKEEEIKTESFHEFIPWYIEARLEGHKNINIMKNEYDSEIIVADILGNTYFGVHGHLDSRPNMVQNLTLMIKRIPTAVVSGHIHKNFEDEIHGVDLIVNGGFAGVNDYAKDRRLTGKSHQKLLWLDENGRKATFYINLD